MSSKTEFRCDVCGHTIDEGHQDYWMTTITIRSREHENDGSAAGSIDITRTYHVHNDFSNHCMHKVWDILEKHKK